MSARPTWKGVLKIALVTIPIKVFPATESSDGLAFNQLHVPCQTRIQQKKWCPTCNCEVSSQSIVKGFEFEAGKYVLLLPEELEAVQPASTKVIDVTQVAAADLLERRAIDRTYVLEADGPDGGPAAQAYAVFAAALDGSVAIGQLAIYGREYLVAIAPHGTLLLLYTLHHAAELKPLVAPAAVRVSRDELTLAARVLHTFEGPLNLATFTDQHQVHLRRLIDAKIAGDEYVVPRPAEAPVVRTLLEALTESLAAAKKIPAKVTPAKRKQAS